MTTRYSNSLGVIAPCEGVRNYSDSLYGRVWVKPNQIGTRALGTPHWDLIGRDLARACRNCRRRSCRGSCGAVTCIGVDKTIPTPGCNTSGGAITHASNSYAFAGHGSSGCTQPGSFGNCGSAAVADGALGLGIDGVGIGGAVGLGGLGGIDGVGIGAGHGHGGIDGVGIGGGYGHGRHGHGHGGHGHGRRRGRRGHGVGLGVDGYGSAAAAVDYSNELGLATAPYWEGGVNSFRDGNRIAGRCGAVRAPPLEVIEMTDGNSDDEGAATTAPKTSLLVQKMMDTVGARSRHAKSYPVGSDSTSSSFIAKINHPVKHHKKSAKKHGGDEKKIHHAKPSSTLSRHVLSVESDEDIVDDKKSAKKHGGDEKKIHHAKPSSSTSSSRHIHSVHEEESDDDILDDHHRSHSLHADEEESTTTSHGQHVHSFHQGDEELDSLAIKANEILKLADVSSSSDDAEISLHRIAKAASKSHSSKSSSTTSIHQVAPAAAAAAVPGVKATA